MKKNNENKAIGKRQNKNGDFDISCSLCVYSLSVSLCQLWHIQCNIKPIQSSFQHETVAFVKLKTQEFIRIQIDLVEFS